MHLQTAHLIAIAVALVASTAGAQPKPTRAKIVVALDVPGNEIPQYVCVLAQGGGCDAKDCRFLPLLKDHFDITGNTATVKPGVKPAADLPPALQSAMRAMGRAESCSKPDARCSPSIELHERDDGNPSFFGNLNCTYNRRATGSDRVAVLSLDYPGRTVAVGVSSLELLGSELTVQLLYDRDPDDAAFFVGIGGDYASNATSLATRERAELTLVPRCALYPIELPPRSSTPNEMLSIKIGGTEIGTCPAPDAKGIAVRIPSKPPTTTATLEVTVQPASGQELEKYESSWTTPLPPRPLSLKARVVGLEWSRHCLTGAIPEVAKSTSAATPAPLTWTALCPRAELKVAGTVCVVEASERAVCRYRCTVPPSMPAFGLPTTVRFTREGDQVSRSSSGERTEHVEMFAWDDTLTYAGQRLDSFVPAAERGVIVAYGNSTAWIGTSRWPLEVLEISRPGAPPHSISLKSGMRPNWELVASPHAACGDIFDIKVRGWRHFDAKPVVRAKSGNLEITTPNDFASILDDLSIVQGIGFVFPQIPAGGGEPILQPIGMTFTTKHLLGYRPGAWEGSVFYELTRTHYTALHPRISAEEDRHEAAYYQRLTGELSRMFSCFWGRCADHFLAGLTVGGGLGGPLLPETRKVGVTPPFALAGIVLRWRPSERWSADLVTVFRFGEKLRWFGFENTEHTVDQTFIGEPLVTSAAAVHLGFLLRIRRSLR